MGEEASRPTDPVKNPDMVIEENTLASPEQSGVNLPNVSVPGNLNSDSGESHIDLESAASAKPHTVLQDGWYAGAGDGYVTDEEQRICKRCIEYI